MNVVLNNWKFVVGLGTVTGVYYLIKPVPVVKCTRSSNNELKLSLKNEGSYPMYVYEMRVCDKDGYGISICGFRSI